MIRRLNIRERIQQDKQLTRGISQQLMEDLHSGEGESTVQPLARIRLNPHNPRKLPMGVEAIADMGRAARGDLGMGTSEMPNEPLLDALAVRVEAIEDPREREAMEELLVLAASIHRDTLIQPIAIERVPDGDFQIIAGERRYLAHLLLGRPTIRAMLRQGGDALRSRLVALAENIARVDLTLAERLNAVEEVVRVHAELYPGTEMTGPVLSRLIHEPKRTAQRYMRFLAAPEPVRRAINSGELNTVREVEEALREEPAPPAPVVEPKRAGPRQRRAGAPKTKVNLGAVTDASVVLGLMRAVVGEAEYAKMYAMVDAQDLEAVEAAWKGFLKGLAEGSQEGRVGA